MKSKQSNNKKLFVPYQNPFSNLEESVNTLMDWSEDTTVQTNSLPHVPPAGEHIPSPHVLLSHGSGIDNTMNNSNVEKTVLNYGNNQPTNLSLWNGTSQVLSIFGSEESLTVDATNAAISLERITKYITQ